MPTSLTCESFKGIKYHYHPPVFSCAPFQSTCSQLQEETTVLRIFIIENLALAWEFVDDLEMLAGDHRINQILILLPWCYFPFFFSALLVWLSRCYRNIFVFSTSFLLLIYIGYIDKWVSLWQIPTCTRHTLIFSSYHHLGPLHPVSHFKGSQCV